MELFRAKKTIRCVLEKQPLQWRKAEEKEDRSDNKIWYRFDLKQFFHRKRTYCHNPCSRTTEPQNAYKLSDHDSKSPMLAKLLAVNKILGGLVVVIDTDFRYSCYWSVL